MLSYRLKAEDRFQTLRSCRCVVWMLLVVQNASNILIVPWMTAKKHVARQCVGNRCGCHVQTQFSCESFR